MERNKYYSQTEILKKYDIKLQAFTALVRDANIQAVDRPTSLGTYNVTAHYYAKEDIDNLRIPLRKLVEK